MSADLNSSNLHHSQDDCEPRLTVVEAAELLHLSPGTLYHFVSEKRIPVIRLSSRCLRFSRTALLLWLDGLTQPAEEPPAHRHTKTKGCSQ
jgi:excisionase family DNA binding protein